MNEVAYRTKLKREEERMKETKEERIKEKIIFYQFYRSDTF